MLEYMRDNGGKTSTLRESLKLLITRLKTHMPHEEENTENFCGATVHTETELRELPKKKKKKTLSFIRLYAHVVLFVCMVVIMPLRPSTALFSLPITNPDFNFNTRLFMLLLHL